MACSSSSDPNKRNFKKALEQYYSKHDRCVVLQRPSGRKYKILTKSPGIHVLEFEAEHMKSALESAVGYGLLRDEVAEIAFSELYFGEPNSSVGKTYSPTKNGENVFRSISEGSDFISVCYGKYHIDEIQSFTEPADLMGYRVSEVQFAYTIVDIENWAREEAVLQWVKDSWRIVQLESETFSRQLEIDLVGKPQEYKLTLRLTSEGWSVE